MSVFSPGINLKSNFQPPIPGQLAKGNNSSYVYDFLLVKMLFSMPGVVRK
ncbi:hypothetical protein AM1BK_29580 [Neobacillus kokaensis]|uniref:Uncharacterized protein n=1 Tax=Neobacillus kokaensis TaxID=2759023 RepID=A0ABQ3N9K4_9BACI|nr:hypothetical protein AM1BK_29580 [Neobacillus kokaensis]